MSTDDSRKDLTGIGELPASQAEGTSGTSEPAPVQDPAPSVDQFESFEDFAKSAAGAEPVPEGSLGPLEPVSPEASSPFLGSESSPTLAEFKAPPETPGEPSPQSPLEQVKSFSETLPVGAPWVPAAEPFSVLILGLLNAHEKEKLSDLLSREKLDIREVDLELQWEAGRILIPRVSEYVGVMIVQALRGAKAEIHLGPSDTIFATSDTHASADPESLALHAKRPDLLHVQSLGQSPSGPHPAEHLPLTAQSSLPQLKEFQVVDTVSASAALESLVVETEKSAEYQEILEALQREIKYKAYLKGATAVVDLTISLTPLAYASQYRLTVTGSAIKP